MVFKKEYKMTEEHRNKIVRIGNQMNNNNKLIIMFLVLVLCVGVFVNGTNTT